MSYLNKPPLNHSLANSVFLNIGSKNQDAVEGEGVNLTKVFQNTLQKYLSHANRNAFIIRLDTLPVVAGEEQQLEKLCHELILMIIQHASGKSKLFLYIKCDEQKDNEVMDLRLIKDKKIYSICLMTNITTDEKWELLYKSKLEDCAALAQQNKGSFHYNPAANSGCLFSLRFPGKLDY